MRICGTALQREWMGDVSLSNLSASFQEEAVGGSSEIVWDHDSTDTVYHDQVCRMDWQ